MSTTASVPPPSRSTRRRGCAVAVGGATLAALLALAGCGGPAPDPAASPSLAPSSAAPSSAASSPVTPPSESPTAKPPAEPSAAPSGDRLPIAITVADGQVTPNGEKMTVPLGTTVVLTVTSDTDDEIHAHTGGDGYELAVKAGETKTGSFTVNQPGSFEVESHHLGKIIVVLNVS